MWAKIRVWKRKNFPDADASRGLRHLAEIETDRDLQKPVQQLLCDVHEESLNPIPLKADGESDEHWNQRLVVLQLQRLIGAQKRMVSLMCRVAWEHERSSNRLVWLTLAIVVMTAALILLTIMLLRHGG